MNQTLYIAIYGVYNRVKRMGAYKAACQYLYTQSLSLVANEPGAPTTINITLHMSSHLTPHAPRRPPSQQPRLISSSTMAGMSKIAVASGGGGSAATSTDARRPPRRKAGLKAGAIVACCSIVKCSPSHGPFSNGVDDAARSSVELIIS